MQGARGVSPVSYRNRIVFVAAALSLAICASADAQQPRASRPIDVTEHPAPAASQPSPIEQTLEQRVRENPNDAGAWRLLGRAYLQRGENRGALEALRNAVRLDDRSAAAWLDYGRVLQEFDQTALAVDAFNRVKELAPESDYATQARETLAAMAQASDVQTASYEIRSFDGSNIVPEVVGPDPSFWSTVEEDFRIRLELGAQYNSNVTMAPSSRELQNGTPASAQGNGSLLVQWYAIDTGTLRFGPSFDSDFTLNEGHVDNLNLQSYRPGAFINWTTLAGGYELKPRVAYTFTHDEFGGNTFGNKHSLAASLGTVWTPGQTSTLYYSLDRNNVANDGATPDITSQDGWSNTIGLLHDVIRRDSAFRLFRLGADYSHTDTTGSNFRYQGVSLYTQENFLIAPKWMVTLKGGWSYRDYFDFTLNPSRDTNILRGSAELRRYFKYGLSAAVFAGYDRFLSDNPQYDTDRFQTGGVLTWEY